MLGVEGPLCGIPINHLSSVENTGHLTATVIDGVILGNKIVFWCSEILDVKSQQLVVRSIDIIHLLPIKLILRILSGMFHSSIEGTCFCARVSVFVEGRIMKHPLGLYTLLI